VCLLTAGIAHQDIQTAEPGDCIRDKLLAEGLVANISGNCNRDPTFCLDERDDFAGIGFFGRKVIYCHINTFARVGNSGSAAHPGITSGNERLASSEPT
jgi:hypothetical protein